MAINTIYNRDGQTFTRTLEFVCVTCYNCKCLFAITREMYDRLQEDSKRCFFCPNGHEQHYAQTDKQRLERELAQQKEATERERWWRQSAETDAKYERRSKNAYRGQVTKLKRRVAHGVCPCCTRTFQNLERHMKSQHPDFIDEKDGENG